MIINHLGKQLDSKHFDGVINKDIVKTIREGYYNEDKELALTQLRKMLNGGSLTNHVYNYYFDRVANDTLVGNVKWTINQALESDEIIQLLHNKTKANLKVYPDQDKVVDNVKTAIRLSGSGICKRPTQFPIKVMRALLQEFTKAGDTYYDPCMGWGMRLMCSAEHGVKYVGNDVNEDLFNKLTELSEDIKKIKDFEAELRLQGSEVFIPELENKVDFVFTSPPYFDLERYKGAGLEDINYEQWLAGFIRPVLQNCLKYVKPGKNVLINIKNTSKYDMYDDTLKIALEEGYEYVGVRELKQPARANPTHTHIYSGESIMVLQKPVDNIK